MKKTTLVAGSLLVAMLLAGCGSTSRVARTDVKADSSAVTDWSNRNLDEEAKPSWLKSLVRGNSQEFRKQFEVGESYVVKYGVASAKTRDASLAASRVNYNAMRAEELRTKVVSEAAATLNDEGFTEATANAATLAKVDLSGHELVTQFWQKIEKTEKDVTSSEYICYSVYKISNESWVNTLKGFLAQVIPSIPDSKAQLKMTQTIQSLYDDTAHEQEVSEQVALAQFRAQEEDARARAAEANAKAAQANATAADKAAAQTASNDIDWMSALNTAASILF